MEANLASKFVIRIRYHVPTNSPILATYTLIHAFLSKREHTKAAQALKKAVKDIVTLEEDATVDGPQLDEIIQQWKTLSTKKAVSKDSQVSFTYFVLTL